MMNNGKLRLIKIAGLLCMLALCLALAGCVVPEDDIDTSGNYVVTEGNLPFQSIAPTITNTPYVPPVTTATPTTVPTRNPYLPQSTATPTPAPGSIGVGNTANPVQSIVNVTPQIIVGVNTPTPAAGTSSSTTLQNGSTGAEVKKMQQRLKELGYLKGSADGDFGDATEAAVRAFQAQNGLTVDGKAGPATLNKLYSSSAK